MFVQIMLTAAAKRLASVAEDAPLIEAARPLSERKVDLVVVCASDGTMSGVISKSDVVRQICASSGLRAVASSVMARNVISCRPDHPLRDVWELMKQRRLKSIPVVNAEMRPVGVLAARDVLETLMEESEYEEALLRDYVMSVGYH